MSFKEVVLLLVFGVQGCLLGAVNFVLVLVKVYGTCLPLAEQVVTHIRGTRNKEPLISGCKRDRIF